jgi:hypothetical protein
MFVECPKATSQEDKSVSLRNSILAALVLAGAAFAQNPITADFPFQVRYAANLNQGESFINITNTGAANRAVTANGNICVNVYVFSPDEQMQACCSCLTTPNGLYSYGVNRDLTSNVFHAPFTGTSVVIKLLATAPATGGTDASCTRSAGLVQTATPVAGLLAWGSTLQPASGGSPVPVETAFTPATLSTAGGGTANNELASLNTRCAAIQAGAGGAGICAACHNVGQ